MDDTQSTVREVLRDLGVPVGWDFFPDFKKVHPFSLQLQEDYRQFLAQLPQLREWAKDTDSLDAKKSGFITKEYCRAFRCFLLGDVENSLSVFIKEVKEEKLRRREASYVLRYLHEAGELTDQQKFEVFRLIGEGPSNLASFFLRDFFSEIEIETFMLRYTQEIGISSQLLVNAYTGQKKVTAFLEEMFQKGEKKEEIAKYLDIRAKCRLKIKLTEEEVAKWPLLAGKAGDGRIYHLLKDKKKEEEEERNFCLDFIEGLGWLGDIESLDFLFPYLTESVEHARNAAKRGFLGYASLTPEKKEECITFLRSKLSS